jgi:DNA end-binding protein Ku
MASRAVWKGYIRFSLVSVPVKAYTAAVTGGGGIALNQLHAECHSRIQYKKTCPIHGEVPNDQIVSGYQFAEGQYVVVDPDELEKLRTPAEKAININAFIKPETIDPSFLSGRSYYLLPDGPVAQRPYAVLLRAMAEEDRYAFAQVVFSGREQIVVVRPVGNLLMMSMLTYANEMKSPSEFQDEAPKVEVSPEELKLAKTLTDALSVDEFDFSEYRDQYTEKLTKLIESKVAGKEIVAPPAEEPPQIINLMEALQKSLAAAKKAQKPAAAGGKPPKLAAPGTAAKAAQQQARKRKTS